MSPSSLLFAAVLLAARRAAAAPPPGASPFGVIGNGAAGDATLYGPPGAVLPPPAAGAMAPQAGAPVAVSTMTAGPAAAAPPPPEPIISDVAAQKVTPFSAVITWTTDKAADSAVAYGPYAIYGSTESDPAPLPQHSVVLQQLTPGMTYHYRVLSQDEKGESTASADETFATPFASQVPPGINLALGKQVWASSTVSGQPSNVVDGNLATGWSSQFSNSEYIQIDLGAPQWIGGVVLSWLGANAQVYEILVSLDGNAWTDAYDQAAGKGATEQLSFAPVQARYVMMSGTKGATQYGYSLAEFQVISALPPPAGSVRAQPQGALPDPRAPQKFLTPARQDGIDDDAVFGSSAREVTIVDLRGRRVFQECRNGADIKWDCRDGEGRLVGSGVYIARIRTADGRTLYQSFAVVK